MIKKATPPQFETFNDNSEADTVTEIHAIPQVPPHFLDSDRVDLYLTLSGLLEAGIPTETALMLVGTEQKAQNRKEHAERIAEFFDTVAKARVAVKASVDSADTVGEAAELCFGRMFVSPNELVLLRGLAHTENTPAILRAAADVIRNRNLSYSPARPTASAGRRFK